MAPVSVAKLTQDRNAVKALIDYLEGELVIDATTPLDQPGSAHLFSMATTCQQDVMKIHRLVTEQNPSDLADHNTEVFALLGRLTRLLSALTGIKNRFVPVQPTPRSATSAPTHDTRLPRLELPTFDGNLQQWISFRDLFTNAIHNKANLSKSEKLTYLKSLVKGDAARLIVSLVVSDVNYDLAWQKLIERYQNERELVFGIFRRFNSQSSISSQSASSLRELIDVSLECVRSLEVFNITLDKGFDAYIMFSVFSKLDNLTKQLWEQQLKDTKIPTFQSLIDFLEQRARALGASAPVKLQATQQPNRQQGRAVNHHNQSNQCACCKSGNHPLYRCSSFLGQDQPTRQETVKKVRSCFNCLMEGHSSSNCPSTSRCRTCNGKHHTLLHKSVPEQESRSVESPRVHMSRASGQFATPKFDTILATAVVHVKNLHGEEVPCRIFLDNGSNSHFMTESFAKRLRTPQVQHTTESVGLGGEKVTTSTHCTTVSVCSRFGKPLSFPVNALIVKRITNQLPIYSYDHSQWSHLQQLELADPQWYKPQKIDMLLGADIFFTILKDGKKSGLPNSPVALNSELGWLVGGGSNILRTESPIVYSITSREETIHIDNNCLDASLRRFWEIEEGPPTKHLTSEQSSCEEHFKSTVSRNVDGRFVVQLPLKASRKSLGQSLYSANKRLLSLERRLQFNQLARQEYSKFMREYEDMGHMVEVNPNQSSPMSYYIPHHFVTKDSSSTTKFRVVFDGSSKTTNGTSLNDIMMVGPTVQDCLVDIIIRFRLHKIVFTADVKMMYRQIQVKQEDADLQRILWRENSSLPMKHYKLVTVTYGTAAAPFLATRCLQELALTEMSNLPLASSIVLRDFYVDDVMSGEPSIQEAIESVKQLNKLTAKAQFPLRKYSSNCQDLLDTIPSELRETQTLLNLDQDPTIKTLGILWNPKTDEFSFKISSQLQTSLTKRTVLSEIAKLFDPIGWLSPVLITAKILMQSLWALNLGWDDELPPDIQQQWKDFQVDLQRLELLRIRRCFFSEFINSPSLNHQHLGGEGHSRYCLVGFSDASEVAYAAAVYICAYDSNNVSRSLITSKTRVAPAKKISIPRLELCGALLLAELLDKVKSTLKIPIHSMTAWTDSTVTLAWINSHPSRWKTFVANRVTKIQELVPVSCWGHVRGEDNPADCASRGINSISFMNHHLWWCGPEWLNDGVPTPLGYYDQPQADDIQQSVETKVISHTTTTTDFNLSHKYSNIHKLLRVTAWIMRFATNCRKLSIKNQMGNLKPKDLQVPAYEPLIPSEIDEALMIWIKIVQQRHFAIELRSSPIPRKSPLLPLNPFIDAKRILRVGGRLKNAPLTPDRKYPILLPRHDQLTRLIIRSTHIDHFHAGAQLVQATISQRYWIVRGRDAIRQELRRCVICTRNAARTQNQMMADLPQSRVTPCRPFENCGVDYAGPFILKPNAPRSKVSIKGYLAIFVCFVTRAIHLEVVSDMSTSAFQAALQRFVARRGRPSHIHSDCGTNFVGASRELKEWLALTRSNEFNNNVTADCLKRGISWHFIPPGAPHFGGLWEAGVKSTKYHLKRILDSHRLTYEEFNTIVVQVEACLNSRPLTAASSDPNDLTVLTPGHFLIGAPLTAVSEPNLVSLKTGHLDRWQLLLQLKQHFWNRWSSEYLTRLQQRPKWLTKQAQIKIDDLVLIKDERMSPQEWKLGRVTGLHPGKDEIVRVATLRTANGEITRPVVKLCLLPIDKCESM